MGAGGPGEGRKSRGKNSLEELAEKLAGNAPNIRETKIKNRDRNILSPTFRATLAAGWWGFQDKKLAK